MFKLGDKVKIKDEYISSLGRKYEVMTIKGFYSLKGNTMVDVGDGISYREDVLELVTEFDKAKAKHEELLAERKKEPKQETNLVHYIDIVSKLLQSEDSICNHLSIFGFRCDDCKICPFGTKENLKSWLLAPYEEPKIELNSMEYYLICEESHLPVQRQLKFEDNSILNNFKNKGYFKGITDTSLKPNEILERAVIVDEK